MNNFLSKFPTRAYVLMIIMVSASLTAFAQNEVAIGSSTTKSNAILWLNGNGSQGLILPTVTNKSAVNNPDQGMIVYDDSDNKVWYRNNSAWVEVGGGSSSPAALNLQLSGNQLQLRDGTSVLNSVNIAGGTQTAGAFLVFQGGTWQFATLSGDVTGANGALQVTGLRGKSIATLPASTQALVYDPSANSGVGGFVFQAFSGGGGITSVSGTAPITVTNPTTTPIISLANAGITNALIADNAVTSAKIADATITGNDIASATIPADKLAASGANPGQVLKWNGTAWVPQNDDTGVGTTPTLNNGQLLIGNGTTNSAVTLSGDATLSGGTLTISNGAITSAKIADGTITAADVSNASLTTDKLAQSGASANQVMQWNGTAWIPATLAGGGSVTTIATGAGLTGGPITTTGTVAIATAGVTNAMLADGAVTSAKIQDGTIAGTDLASNIAISTTGTVAVTGGGILSGNGSGITSINANNITSGTLPVERGGTGATTLTANSVLVGNGTSAISSVTTGANGQVLTISGGVPVWQNAPTGFTNPMTNSGDLITGGAAGAAQRFGIGANGQVLTVAAGGLAWQTPVVSGAAGGDLSGTYPNPTVAPAAITSAKLAAGAVQTSNLLDGAVTNAKITDVAPSKILSDGASSGQVLKWNGSAWTPQPDAVGGGGAPTLNPGQVMVGDGTSNSAVTVGQDAVLNSTNGNITVQGFRGRPLSAAVPSANSVYQYDGSQWSPVVLAGGGTVSQINTGTGLTGGPITATGTVAIADGGVGTLQLANNSVTAAKLQSDASVNANRAVTTNHIQDLAVTDAKIASGVTPGKLAPGTNGQVLTTVGGVPAWQNAATGFTNPMTTQGDLITGGTGGTAGRLAAGTNGQVLTVSGGIPTWQAASVSGAAGGDLTGSYPNPTIATTPTTGNTIVTAINASSSSINGARVNPTFGAQTISTTGTVSAGATTVSSLTVPGTTTFNTRAYTWPNTAAAANTYLSNDGTGNLSWTTVAGGTDVTTQTGVLLGDGSIITGSTAGAGVRGILGSNNNTIGWVTGTPNQLLGTNVSGDLQFMDKSSFVSATLPLGQLLVGNASNSATPVAMSGDATLSNAGVLTIANNAITTAKISNNAITTDKILDGTITGADLAATTITADKLAASGASDGQVLKFNGTNWVPGTDIAGAGGFSTLNTVPKGDGATLVASQIFDDGTNVGIGTLSPAHKLQVESTSGRAISATNSDAVSATIRGENTGNGIALAGVASGAGYGGRFLANDVGGTGILSDGGGTGILARAGGTSGNKYGVYGSSEGTGTSINYGVYGRAFGGTTNYAGYFEGNAIATGNLGIGTTTPNAPLQFPNIVGRKIVLWEAVNNDHQYIGFGVGGTGTLESQIPVNSNAFVWKTATSATTSNELMRLTGTGNVGIGISAPLTKLHVAQDVLTFATVSTYNAGATVSPAIQLHKSQGTIASPSPVLSGEHLGRVLFSGQYGTTSAQYSTSSVIRSDATEVWSSTNTGSALLFLTKANGSAQNIAPAERMRIDHNGNVGISSNNPANRLSVSGGASIGSLYAGTAAPTDGLIVQGNVGIGTAISPANRLTVAAGASIGGGFTGAIAPTNGLIVQGNVGIGTSAPGSKLHIGDNINGVLEVRISNPNAGASVQERLLFGTTTGTDAGFLMFGPGSANAGLLRIFNNRTTANFDIVLGGSVRFGITSAGNVGMGRTASTNRLEVEGNASKTAAGGFLANSDKRIKTDILDIDNSLDLVKKLRPVKFKYTQEWMEKHPSLKDQYYYNFIAQEFQEVFPESVQGSGEYIDTDKNEILQIDTHHAQIATIKAVQELIKKVEVLEKENSDLTKQLNEFNKLQHELEEQSKHFEALQADVESLKKSLILEANKD